MNIKKERPPNYDRIAERFPLSGSEIFCYGDTIYNPSGGDLTPALIAHERVHSERQGDDPEGWWERYLTDAEFRLYEEVIAHRKEFQVYRKMVKDREHRNLLLMELARRLSSPQYDLTLTTARARALIRAKQLPTEAIR